MYAWWYMCVLRALLTVPAPIPLMPANPYKVHETLLRQPGSFHWGRQVAFATWLVGVFGEETAHCIWLHIRTQHGGGRHYDEASGLGSPV